MRLSYQTEPVCGEQPRKEGAQGTSDAAAPQEMPAAQSKQSEHPEQPTQPQRPQPQQASRRAQWLQVLKFTGFSISAGVIQLVSDGILCDWTGWLPWWPAYLISVLLSVIWNFTFNRKFTFRAANNVPVAMGLVALYYCAFIPLSVFGGDAIAARLPAKFGLLVTFMMMVVNFVTEFIWDKFAVFNDRVTEKVARLFVKKRAAAEFSEESSEALSEEAAPADAAPAAAPQKGEED